MSDVIVVGSVNVDVVTRVATLPRPGETVIGSSLSRVPGGKGANQAAAGARLGARTWLVGLVGPDHPGVQMRDDLTREGVDVSFLGTGTRTTGAAVIMVAADGENLIAVDSGANDEVTGELVWRAFEQIAAEQPVVLADLEVPDEAVRAAARGAKERGWRFVLNPAPARVLPAELIADCDVLTPNEHEVSELGAASVEELLERGAGAVVVTRGAQGARIYRRGRPAVDQEPFPVDPVDTTGAGDAFSATLAWSLAEGAALEEAVRLAAAAGALATREVGARSGFPSRAELEGFAGPRLRAVSEG